MKNKIKWLYHNGYLKKSKHLSRKNKKVHNPKTLKEIAKETIEKNEKNLGKELGKKTINPYYFIDRNLKTGFKFNLKNRNFNHATSVSTNTLNVWEFGIEPQYFNKIMKETVTVYARIINQNKFIYHTFFQLVCIRLMKKTKKVLKLIYLSIWTLIII